jgi:predicted nucleic acid-binding protein
MIVLDTNVLSELMRPKPTAEVVAWIASQPASLLYTTTITEAEVFSGIRLMPDGGRRSELLATARGMFDEDFAGRVLPFDSEAAQAFAAIVAARRSAGRGFRFPDAQIAAIAASHHASVCTRNVDDFESCGIEVVNPWDFPLAVS